MELWRRYITGDTLSLYLLSHSRHSAETLANKMSKELKHAAYEKSSLDSIIGDEGLRLRSQRDAKTEVDKAHGKHQLLSNRGTDAQNMSFIFYY